MRGVGAGKTAVDGSPATEAFEVGRVIVEARIAAQASRHGSGAFGAAGIAGRAGASGSESESESIAECTCQTIRGRCLAAGAGMSAGRTRSRRTEEVADTAPQTVRGVVAG